MLGGCQAHEPVVACLHSPAHMHAGQVRSGSSNMLATRYARAGVLGEACAARAGFGTLPQKQPHATRSIRCRYHVRHNIQGNTLPAFTYSCRTCIARCTWIRAHRLHTPHPLFCLRLCPHPESGGRWPSPTIQAPSWGKGEPAIQPMDHLQVRSGAIVPQPASKTA